MIDERIQAPPNPEVQTESLRRVIDEARAAEGGVGSATAQLQERLRLGARMLKAFQSQIERVESAIARAESSHATAQLSAQAAETRLAEFTSRVDQIAKEAITRIETAAGTVAERFEQARHEWQAELAAGEEGAKAARRTAEAVTRLIEGAEVNAAAVAHKGGRAAEHALAAVKQARDAAEQCGRAAEPLAESIAVAETFHQSLAERIETARQTIAELDGLEELAGTLSNLLDRLSPWEPVLLGGAFDGEHMPAPVASAIDYLRSALSEQMMGLPETMRELAGRIDELLTSTGRAPARSSIALNDVHVEPQPEIVSMPSAQRQGSAAAPFPRGA